MNTAAPPSTPLPGDLVEVVKTSELQPDLPVGLRFIVEGVTPAVRPGDYRYADAEYIQEALIDAWLPFGTIDVEASAVKVIAPAGQVEAPTRADIAKALNIDTQDFEFRQSSLDEDSMQILFRHVETGLDYTATITVTDLQRTE